LTFRYIFVIKNVEELQYMNIGRNKNEKRN
jgi:hypothetical protein